jgi:hypothetical protein
LDRQSGISLWRCFDCACASSISAHRARGVPDSVSELVLLNFETVWL